VIVEITDDPEKFSRRSGVGCRRVESFEVVVTGNVENVDRSEKQSW
jgi:hypothetical protein